MNGTITSEAELIATYLVPLAGPGGFGLADDAGLIVADGAHDLVVTTDPIIAGVHFFPDDGARDIAWKAVAVNISDLIAKGATPFAYTLTLALPDAPLHAWMADFALGLKEAQSAFGCSLIGGDTDRTPGALSVAVTVFGKVPCGGMVRRLTARQGDEVFVSGTIGDAALGLQLRRGTASFGAMLADDDRNWLLARYLRPEPEPALMPLLRAHATAAMDISDGLVQDAGKLAKGASAALAVRFEDVPLSSAARSVVSRLPHVREMIVAGGDDYEVLFTVSPETVPALIADAAQAGVQISRIGTLAAGDGVTVIGGDGTMLGFRRGGYDHFGGAGA